MTGTLALLPTMLQNLMNYPALTTGMVTMPRGIGSMAVMFLVAPLINRVDTQHHRVVDSAGPHPDPGDGNP